MNNVPEVVVEESITYRGGKITIDGVQTFSSEIVPIYFHQSGHFKETVKEIKDMIINIVPARLIRDIKYFYSYYQTKNISKFKDIIDDKPIEKNHRFSVVIICCSWAEADFVYYWIKAKLPILKVKEYHHKINIPKPQVIRRDILSIIPDITDFINGMFGELVQHCNKERLQKDITKYKATGQKVAKRSVTLLHLDDGLKGASHTAFSSLYIYICICICIFIFK